MLVATINGVAETDPTYASDLVKNLPGVDVLELYWGNVPDVIQAKLLNEEKNAKAWSNFAESSLRVSIDNFLGDAILWLNPVLKAQIKTALLQQLGSAEPTVLVLYSWGCVILADLLADPDFAGNFHNVTHIFTAGCPLLLYDTLVKNEFTLPNQYIWVNFYNKFDLVASPLSGYLTGNITDVEITDSGPQGPSLGDIDVTLAGSAHTCYFSSKMLAKSIMDMC